MRPTRSSLLLALATLALAACGSSDPKAEGFAALGSGDFAAASTALGKALEGLDRSDPSYMEVAVGRCQALAHVDAEQAKNAFLALASSSGDAITDRDYNLVVTEMVGAKAFVPAIAVLDHGVKRFSESPKMLALKDKVVQESQKAGDSGALEALQGLGYLGGD